MGSINKLKISSKPQEGHPNSKDIVKWGMWYASITTALYFILIYIGKDVPESLVALTGTVVTVIVAAYAYKAKGENIAKINNGSCLEETAITETISEDPNLIK